MVRTLTAVVAAIAILGGGRAHAQAPGFGAQTGHATPAQVAALRQALATFVEGERRINDNARGGGLFDRERQRQMLGETPGDRPNYTLEDLLDYRRLWIRNILNPALQVAASPAASCALARSMLTRVLNVERQGQMVFGEQQFGDFADPNSPLGRIWSAARQRCLEEAYDECMATGNVRALAIALTDWGRQVDLVQGEARGDWDRQVIYLLRRCAVFRVGYHTELRDTRGGRSLTADGSVTLVFRPANSDVGPQAVAGGLWMSRPNDPQPPDFRMVINACGDQAPSCSQLPMMWRGVSWSSLDMQRDMTEQTVLVVATRDEAREMMAATAAEAGANSRVIITDEVIGELDGRSLPAGATALDYGHFRHGVIILRTIRHREGQDRLVLNFGPPMVSLRLDGGSSGHGVTNGSEGEGTELFYAAIARDMESPEEGGGDPGLSPFVDRTALPNAEISPLVVNNDHWSRGIYPVLFTAGSARGQDGPTERTTFEITHRPDLFPSEEVVPSLELQRQPQPQPIPIP